MKQHTEKELARAKRVRDKRLVRMATLFAHCKCMFPLETQRNGSGHSSDCPAHALHRQFKEEDADLHAELDR